MTWRELVYMIIDLTKQVSDDSTFNEDHIKMLCSKYRNYILNQQYLTNRKTINEANYQTLNVDLELVNLDWCSNDHVLKSVEKIPFTMPIGQKEVYGVDIISNSKISFVPFKRFPYVGASKFTNNTIYASIGPDNYLYVKSKNNNFIYLKSITIKALFEDIEEASLLDATSCGCDVMDTKFPLEDAWMNTLINLVVNDLTRGIYQLRDTTNDAMDSSDDLAQAISRYTNTAFKNLMRGNQNNGQS